MTTPVVHYLGYCYKFLAISYCQCKFWTTSWLKFHRLSWLILQWKIYLLQLGLWRWRWFVSSRTNNVTFVKLYINDVKMMTSRRYCFPHFNHEKNNIWYVLEINISNIKRISRHSHEYNQILVCFIKRLHHLVFATLSVSLLF